MRQVPVTIPQSTWIAKLSEYPLTGVFALAFNAQFGFYLLMPLLTFVFFATDSSLFSSETTFAERSFFYGLCLSLSKISSFVGSSFVSAISDYRGRQAAWYISISALMVVAICGFFGLLWKNPIIFTMGFVLYGLLDVNKSTGLANVSDISHADNLVLNMGTLQCLTAAGACIGPILGGYIAEKSLMPGIPYSLPFLFSLIIGLISFGIIYFYQTTFSVSVKTMPVLKFNMKDFFVEYLNLIRERDIQQLFIVLILSQISWSTYYEFIGPLLKNEFNFSPHQVGLFMGGIAFWLVIAAGFGLRFLDRWFSMRQMIFGSIISVIMGTMISLIAGIYSTHGFSQTLLWSGAIPVAMGDVILYSLLASLLANKINPAQRGKAMGLNLTIGMLVWSVMALWGSYLITLNPLGVLYFAPLGVIILLAVLFLFKPHFWFLIKTG